MSEFSLPITTSFLISTETLKIKYFSLTTFVPEGFFSRNPVSVDWTFGIPQPEERWKFKQRKLLICFITGISWPGYSFIVPSRLGIYIIYVRVHSWHWGSEKFRNLPKETSKTVSTESMPTRCLPGFSENVLADWAFKSFVQPVDEFYLRSALVLGCDNHSVFAYYWFALPHWFNVT